MGGEPDRGLSPSLRCTLSHPSPCGAGAEVWPGLTSPDISEKGRKAGDLARAAGARHPLSCAHCLTVSGSRTAGPLQALLPLLKGCRSSLKVAREQ